VICDVNDAQGEAVAAEIGDGASFVHCDVTDEGSVEAAVAAAVEALGRLDGAFNCAGILAALGNSGDVPLAEWQKVIDVDLTGVYLCTKHQLGPMAAQKSGSILNMASAAGLIGWPGAGAYVAAKHGVVGLSKSAALEYAEQGIRVNSICPSYVITPMVEKDLFEDALGNDQELIAAARANHPIGRFAEAGEIAAAACWLLSDKASFVTGSAMSVDGGYTTP
jgi:NAD(P)-dependent dehydrogenase (short-subunit alcohol dehydrogenase family)